MLDRFRDFVKRLELPQDDEVVYRIIDEDSNAVEVTQSQYIRWRLQHDVTQSAVVGEDTIENVKVRTTFSIMPENRNYKPFGTSAFDVASLDPLLQYSVRYDTWEEAERGHRHTLEVIRRDSAMARVVEERVESLAGVAGEVRLAISAGLPAIFQVTENSDTGVTVSTPLTRADGSSIEMTVAAIESGFRLSAPIELTRNSSILTLSRLRSEQVNRVCGELGVSLDDASLMCDADDTVHLGEAIVKLSQGLVCLTYLANARL